MGYCDMFVKRSGDTVRVLKVKGRGCVRARTHETFLSHMQIIYSIVSPRTRTPPTSQLIALSSPETFSATGPLPACPVCLSRYWPSIVPNNDSNNTCVLMASINYRSRSVCTCKVQPQQTIFHKKTYHEWSSFYKLFMFLNSSYKQGISF